jgi:hypothetical protein
MNNVGRILLLVGVVALALLVGVLIGRGQRIAPTADVGNASAVQITTAPPPSAAPPPPLPASIPAPQPAAAPKVAPDQQVQEDAAAVGMTTKEPADQGAADTSTPAPKSAAAAPASGQTQPPAQPNG